MTRLPGWVAVCLLGTAISVQLVWAQTQSVGCDGAVVLKAGRSGACTEMAQTIAGLVEEPAVVEVAQESGDLVELVEDDMFSVDEVCD